MRRLFQLDQPGGLRNIRLTTMEKQDDGLGRRPIPITEYLRAAETYR